MSFPLRGFSKRQLVDRLALLLEGPWGRPWEEAPLLPARARAVKTCFQVWHLDGQGLIQPNCLEPELV